MRVEHVTAHTPDVPLWASYTNGQRWSFVAVLFLVSTSNYFDRVIVSVLLEPIKVEFQVSDTMLGLLSGFCFALFYAMAGIPVARWADHGNRRIVITLALTAWSVMTMLCGMAQTFWQLALARVGVGAGESGAIPPAQSLIVDYFPPERRATALAIFTAAGTPGYLLALGIGGYVAETQGWRNAFMMAGAPGLALALVAWVILPEPRLQRGSSRTYRHAEGVREAFWHLCRKRAFLYALIGSLLYSFCLYGGLVFAPTYLIRVLHVPLTEVGVGYGTVSAVGSLLGTLGGGWLADRLSGRDIRWLAWLPAIACISTGPLYISAFAVDHYRAFLALAFVAHLLLVGGLPPILAAIHMVCGNRRRATAIAIFLFSGTLFGGGLGPLATGALSDALTAVYGVEGLRYAIIANLTLLVASGVVFNWCARAMPSDRED